MNIPTSDRAAMPEHRDHRLRGIGLMCLAIVFFTSIDTLGKFLIHHMPTLQVVWGRFAFAFLLGYLICSPFPPPSLPRPAVLRTQRPWLQFARSVLLLSCTGLMTFSLYYLQLDQALAIMFSTPFFVAALSIPILGERVGWRRWAAICGGFGGVLVVIRPGFGGIHPVAFLVLTCAIFYAFYSIITRLLSRHDSSETTLFYSNIVGAVVMTAILPFVWQWPESPWHAVLLVLMGAVGMLGHYLLILAHRVAPASVLSPFIYTQLVWVIIAGYLVFGDLPNRWTLLGSAMVIASGLYLLNRERKVRGEDVPPSADPVA
jgi:drug/metabolite transporter (DMT)-like permease